MQPGQRIVPCLWFNDRAEEAATFYIGIFKNSRVTAVSHYGKAGQEHHRRPVGSVMVVAFELDGQPFTALNGGPMFTFNEAISLQVNCDTQQEIDHYWSALGEGGDPKAQQCGWLKDKFGVSWQINPSILPQLLRDGEGSQRVMAAVMQMKKIDIAKLKQAHTG